MKTYAEICKGDTVHLKPQWQDKGDDRFHWVAVEDADGGRVKICPVDCGLTLPPIYVVDVEWLEECQKCAS